MKLYKKTDYLNSQFEIDKAKHTAPNKLSTGFAFIDDYMPIRPGVYLIGGFPSVGKTTFLLQLADHFASLGQKVLFLSLEQSEYDLTMKSLNRIAYQTNDETAHSIKTYKSFADNIATITSNSAPTVEELADMIKSYVNMYGHPSAICLDYLQLIRSKKHSNKKDAVEHVSNTVVSISKEYDIPLFVLSSLNRANYMSPIDFESFKESGALEYDADVVFGLQYQIVRSDAFISCSSIDKKRIILHSEKEAGVRNVELICLKNRFGPIIPAGKMQYLTKHDLFIESKTVLNRKNKNICSF